MEVNLPVRVQMGDGKLIEVGRVVLDPLMRGDDSYAPRRLAEFFRSLADALDGGQ